MKLGTLLLRDAVISLSQLEAALRAQVLYGGRLGTNLVELGHLDVDTLAHYLGRSLALPVADQPMFEAVTPEVISSFDGDLAEYYGAFPLGSIADEMGRPTDALAIALVNPNDRRNLEQLAGQLGRPVAPYIAPELRIYYYLERHYGIERKARFLRTAGDSGREAAEPVSSERRRAQPAHGLEMPKAVRFEPQPSPPRPERIDTAPNSPAATARNDPRITSAAARKQIANAASRNHIGDTLLEFAIGRFDALAILILRDANAVGWRAYSRRGGDPQPEFETVSLPLGGASALQAAHDSRQPFRGAPPTAGRQVEKRLWSALGLDSEPGDMVVVPVLVRSRVVNLIYAHAAPGEALSQARVDALIHLADVAAETYVRLIKEARVAAAGAR